MDEALKNKRYIFDPLYGINYFPDFVWNVINSPELQRLREVRLCNINSFCLVGAANINRYEHAIGTCILAKECLNSWPLFNPISKKEYELFLLAALFHDITSAAFGHSVEYIESKEGFEHEKAFEYIVLGKKSSNYNYKSVTLEPIFFGMCRELLSRLTEEDLKIIGKIIAGKGRFGPLINSDIDLDNIDNVFRLGYHIGIVKSGDIPLELAKSLYIESDKLIAREESIPLFEMWYNVRKNLYSLLLLNPEEFSAKCMLSEAIEIAKVKNIRPFNWYHVDFEVLEKLSKKSSETSVIISRLMTGNLYGCAGIFSTKKTEFFKIFNDLKRKEEIENDIKNKIQENSNLKFKSLIIKIHIIVDINKTERKINITTENKKFISIGNSSNQLLIGVFFKNVDLNFQGILNIPSHLIYKIHQIIINYLSNILNDPELKKIELYNEIKEQI